METGPRCLPTLRTRMYRQKRKYLYRRQETGDRRQETGDSEIQITTDVNGLWGRI